MVNWLPDKFSIFLTLVSQLTQLKTLLLFGGMIVVFFIPTVMAVALLSAEMYGYAHMMFAFVRVLILSNGGWILENTRVFSIDENLSWFD